MEGSLARDRRIVVAFFVLFTSYAQANDEASVAVVKDDAPPVIAEQSVPSAARVTPGPAGAPVPPEPLAAPAPSAAADSSDDPVTSEDTGEEPASPPNTETSPAVVPEDDPTEGEMLAVSAEFEDSNSSFNFTATSGGEFRYRYMDEADRLRPGGPGRSTYDLWRIRAHLDMNLNDVVKGFVEAIDASQFDEELPVTPIDENRSDLLRFYIDTRLAEFCNGHLNIRVGRQFLKYGSQHLVSPLAWGNTFRNFEGIRTYYTGDTWDVDGFWTKPVNSAAGNLFRPRSADHPDASRNFSGVYVTYKGLSNHTIDAYWLFLDEDEDRDLILDGERHTFGARLDSRHELTGPLSGTLAFELEGAFQVGESETFLGAANEDIASGMVHTALGYTLTGVDWKPSIKGIFYWGSGDDSPGDGTNQNFNPLFPLGHAYWGIIDNLNGSNLLDYGVQGTLKPSDELTFVSAFHWFYKHEGASPIFNVGGVPVPAGPSATMAREIGTELDLIATYVASDDTEIQLGYSWFWYGDAVERAAAPLPRDDASQLYVMTTISF